MENVSRRIVIHYRHVIHGIKRKPWGYQKCYIIERYEICISQEHLMTSTAFINSDGLNLIEIIQRLKLDFLEEDVTTYPIRQKHRELVIGMF